MEGRQSSISRRHLIWVAAGTAGFVLSGSTLWKPTHGWAQAGVVMPRPLPGGINTPWGVFIHHYPPKTGGDLANLDDPSQITDFDGLVCDSRVFGVGTGTDLKSGSTARYPFMADMGIMKGTYIGEDGQRHSGVFGFV